MCVFQVESRMEPTNTPPATKGNNVLIDLPLEVDLEALGNRFSMPGKLAIIDWSKTVFPS